jgi:putative transposase
MKFGFIAKHRGIWPAGWLCGALGVSRGGFYAWLTRPRSQRRRSDEELGAKVRTSFLGSDRTYGAQACVARCACRRRTMWTAPDRAIDAAARA